MHQAETEDLAFVQKLANEVNQCVNSQAVLAVFLAAAAMARREEA